MQVYINGQDKQIAASLTVQTLLDHLALKNKRYAVEYNGAILPRSQHAETALCEGDKIEIIHAVGGG